MKKNPRLHLTLRAVFLMTTLLAIAFSSYAYSFFVNGIYYNINSSDGNKVYVTYMNTNYNSYSGSVTIPSSVSYNGKSYSVTDIGSSAFRNCNGLTSVTIPTSVTSIGNSAFYNCTGLTSVTIPTSVTSIGSSAFSNCTGLTKLTWNAKNCSSNGSMSTSKITQVTIGTSVQVLPSDFVNSSKITSLTIPSSVTSIGNSAFNNCTGLTSVTIPTSVTSIGNNAFSNCTGLTKLTWNAKNCSSNGNMHTSNITQATIGSSVQVLPDYFVRGSKITSITIPTSVTSIGGSAFNNCTGLTSVTIPTSVTSIGVYAFQYCIGLSSVTIPTSVTSIGTYAFQGCTALKTLNYNAISCEDFSNSSYPFFNLNISTINIGSGVHNIPAYFAYGLSAVNNITIPSSVTSIGNSAFQNCSGLTKVTIGNSVSSMGSKAFVGCSSITNLIWNAKNCSDYGSMPTSNITQVTIGSSVQVLPDNFASNSRITSVTIPNSVQTIGYNAFSGCTGLASVTFPNSVTYIGGNAFSNCTNLNTISLPNSVFSIDQYAFSGCTKLAKVYCRAIMPPVIDTYYNNMFDAVTYQNAILYVPDLTYGYYIQTNPWNLFHEIKTASYSDGGTAFNSTIYPTSVRVEDASQTANGYFMFNGQRYNTRLLVTGLEPDHIYSATYIKGGVETPFKFYTSSLMMVPEGATMLTETTALLKAETNMADEETICGFDWRRYEGPDDYLGTRVYCPVYDGQMAGTLKNLTRDTFYKFRPFYKSSNGSVHYGDWVTFYTADAGVEFDPVVYTYNYPAVTQTEATLQGVALRGSDVITQQGFEYRKATSSTRTKVTATGERMSKTVSGLQPGTKYKFRAFVTAGGKTTYGDEMDFTTLTNTVGGDANGDGVVNISDVTDLISYLMSGSGSGINLSNADVNGDGVVNISDVTDLISSLLGGN